MSGPSDERTNREQLLNLALASSNERMMAAAMTRHGSISEDEIPILTETLNSRSQVRRENAARLLATTRGGDEALRGVVRVSDDLPTWAIAVNARCDDPELGVLVAEQQALAEQALRSVNPEQIKAGICAGLALGSPNIEEAASKLLDWPEASVRAAAARALAQTGEEQTLALLIQHLQIEAAPEPWFALMRAVVRRDDPACERAIRAAYGASDQTRRVEILNGLGDAWPAWASPFLKEVASTPTPDRKTALVLLGRRPDPDFVRICAELLADAPPSGDPARAIWLIHVQPCQEGLAHLLGRELPTPELALEAATAWLEGAAVRPAPEIDPR